MNQGAMPDQKITTLRQKDTGLQPSTSNNLLEMIFIPCKNTGIGISTGKD